ncbi:Clp protease [Candidatus Micrarchaeota archaeon CG11_big_fil_rev_8_21_14_0_20_47_5]|nr:MAG: hypothetical protein AUJ17_04920 [Candidatus Micrarchaeota archaeon CG1_02_47_40]PIN83899.1 MAG: Clp protease [Candidatus Micrarchaeota archaeon CG11_big_fil_rev_8_21_14_0_20_47_5]
MKKKAVFLDRDGVINEYNEGYVKNVGEFRFIEGALEGMKVLHDAGFLLFIISNQAGVAKGRVRHEDLEGIGRHMEVELGKKGVEIKKTYYCTHSREENCNCRKPKTRFLLEAAEEFGISLQDSWVVGDNTSDIKMGKDAGCKTVLVKTGLGGRDGNFNVNADFVCEDLLEAAGRIVERSAD